MTSGGKNQDSGSNREANQLTGRLLRHPLSQSQFVSFPLSLLALWKWFDAQRWFRLRKPGAMRACGSSRGQRPTLISSPRRENFSAGPGYYFGHSDSVSWDGTQASKNKGDYNLHKERNIVASVQQEGGIR